MGQIEKGGWVEGCVNGPNPGKHFVFKLAADEVFEVNKRRNENGLTFARKSIIRCRLALNLNGVWEEVKLSAELQVIVQRQRVDFQAPILIVSAASSCGVTT